MMTYTVHTYYSNHETSDVEYLEMTINYGYGKRMPAQRKIIPPKKAR